MYENDHSSWLSPFGMAPRSADIWTGLGRDWLGIFWNQVIASNLKLGQVRRGSVQNWTSNIYRKMKVEKWNISTALRASLMLTPEYKRIGGTISTTSLSYWTVWTASQKNHNEQGPGCHLSGVVWFWAIQTTTVFDSRTIKWSLQSSPRRRKM